jgi:putative FmdB family regulatory protein
MPLYEYECDVCGHRFERIQKFSDPLADTCPKCGGAVHKLMSSPAFQFKGSGFYITDYPKKDHEAAAKADSGTAEKADTSEKPEKAEKAEKSEKPGKGDKSEKSGKTDKADTPTKTDKSSSPAGSSPPTSSSSGSSSKTQKSEP